MWYSSRGNKRRTMQLLRLCLLVIFISTIVNGDKSVLERIKKHQEWLRQRNEQKQKRIEATRNFKNSIELPNLWRFPKDDSSKESPSKNDVYPENESILATTPTATTITTLKLEPPSTTTNTPDKIDSTPYIGTMEATTVSIFAQNFDDATLAPVIRVNRTIPTTTAEPPISTNALATTIATTIATTKATTTAKPKSKQRGFPRWGNWSQWSECSRSCAGGVMYQQRKCINRNAATGKRYVSNDCNGIYRRYQLCNDEPCPVGELDFRSQQCAAYNDVDFQGQKYTWEPHIKDDAECELNCKPLGMKYFATLNASVIDGTPCNRPAEYYRSNYRDRAICVAGICKLVQHLVTTTRQAACTEVAVDCTHIDTKCEAIHASGIITGLSASSGAISCGGLICRPVTGIFTRDLLPEDAYVHVTTIPAGASNISITELKNSINLLVLRTEEQKYIFNGDNIASDSGAYEAVDAIFDYHRIDGLHHSDGVTEWITCTGPIRDSLELMVYSKAVNPGIKYEYLLPIASDSEENELSLESDGFLKSGNEETSASNSRSTRRRRYQWKVIGFSSCTKSCGGGTQKPVVRCVRENFPQRYFSQRRCMNAEKPVLNENLLRCNTQPCPAYWRLDEWGECHCHQGEGHRQREISCVQELASGIVIHVDNSACMEEQPSIRKPCDCPKNRRRTHARYRTQLMNGTQHQHLTRYGQRERGGVWLMSEWNQFCSADCGDGVEYRTIFCDRSKSNAERCNPMSTPELTRACEGKSTCDQGEWFAGPWSSCNGNCFNLTRTRQVLCIQNQLIVDDEDCRTELKPTTVENCSHEEVEYCAPRWHYSEWTECSKSCDNGTQRRHVKCLEYDSNENMLRDSTKCRYALREPIYRSCNTHKCEDPRFELLQNDVAAASCMDEVENCQWAVKAKLCSYKYYQQQCCYSCNA